MRRRQFLAASLLTGCGDDMRMGIGLGLGNVQGGGGVPATQFTDVSGLVRWVRYSNGSGVGDGNEVTSLADASGSGASAMTSNPGQSVAGPTYEDDLWAGGPCLLFNNGPALFELTSGPAIDLRELNDGASAGSGYTLVTIYQVIDNNQVFEGGWGRGADGGGSTTDGWYQRHSSGASGHNNGTVSRPTAAAALTYEGQVLGHGPRLTLTIEGPTALQSHYCDGEAIYEDQQATVGAYSALTVYEVGGNPTSSSGAGSGVMVLRHSLLYDHALDSTEIDAVYAAARALEPALAWKAGLGATSANGTAVIVGIGQSNLSGRGASDYLVTASRVYNMNRDGHRYLLTGSNSRTNESVATTPPLVFIEEDLAEACLFGSLTATLRASITEDIVIVNTAKSGQGYNDWVQNADSVLITANMGEWRHRLKEAMKHPSAVLYPIVVYMGENDALDAGDAAAIETNMDTIRSEIEAFVTAEGWTWAFDCHYIVVNLPTAAPTNPSYSEWATCRTNIAAWVAADTDERKIVQAPAATLDDNLHLDRPALQTLGDLIADEMAAL